MSEHGDSLKKPAPGRPRGRPRETLISRRRALQAALSLAVAGLGQPSGGSARIVTRPRFRANPFALGVASGDPLPHGLVLWTRLLPEPAGTPPAHGYAVRWELALDDRLRRVVRSGTVTAGPERAHAVHVDVDGLDPGRWYWYRFSVGDEQSPIGRTRTAPARGATPDAFRFAFASCQHYEAGYWAAHRHLAAEDLDLVVFLGDYIYESSRRSGRVRDHDAPEPRTLDAYRTRYALYKSDPDLQAAHAAFPWVVTWDDHEVDNDYAGAHSQDFDPPAAFLRRRAAAYRAYYEHQPLRAACRPEGAHMRLYRRLAVGDLAQLHVLDNRQHRSDQPCAAEGEGGGRVVVDCAERLEPELTMLGARQERWLRQSLERSDARWNVIVQQQLMADWDSLPGPGERYWTDAWSGYPAARRRLLSFLGERRPSNPVVIGGDIHSFWATELKADFQDPDSATVASELVCTSVSSPPHPKHRQWHGLLEDSPHLRYFEGRWRGYARVHLARRHWHTDFRIVEDARDPDSPVRTLASFVIEDGRPGIARG